MPITTPYESESIMSSGDPSLTNSDLAPVERKDKNWSWVNMATVWMGMVHNIVAYEAAAGLIAMGMSAIEAILCVGVAYFALFVAMWFNAKAGTKYGIPFCVIIRSSFGPIGAQFPVVVRAFVAIFWCSIQLYAGSQAINAIMGTLITGWSSLTYNVAGMTLNGWLSMMAFWAMTALVLNHGVKRVKNFELVAGPLVILVAALAVVWAIKVEGGLGPIFQAPSHLSPGLGGVFEFAVGASGILGIWTTFAVNIPDLSRFVKSERDQVIGQLVGLPITALIFTAMSVIVTSATQRIYGHAIWDPVTLLVKINNPYVTIFGGITIIVATISVNIAGNILPAAFDLVNFFPRKLNFVKAGVAVMVIALFFAPWLWFQNAATIFEALGMIGGLLGPVTGIMLADYYYVRRQSYDVLSLYRRPEKLGRSGVNMAGVIALIVGGFFSLVGFFYAPLNLLSEFSWFVGIGVGAFVYVAADRFCFRLGRRHEDHYIVTNLSEERT